MSTEDFFPLASIADEPAFGTGRKVDSTRHDDEHNEDDDNPLNTRIDAPT